MIRALNSARGSTTGTLASRTGSTPPSSSISAWASLQDGEVRAHRLLFGRRERAEHERARHLADLVAGQVGHGVRAAHDDPSSRTRRIASSPSRIRLLTVPSGVPVRSAISCWVIPPK